MNIQELFATLGLEVDVAAFARGEAALEAIKVAGQLVKKAFTEAFDVAVETAAYADDVDAAAQKTGVAAEALQELTHAAAGAGFDLSSMSQSLGFLNKAMVQSKSGSKELAALFKDLGVEVTDGNRGFLSAQDVLEQLADKFAAMPDGAEKSAAAVALFGKSGAQMIPFLNKGADGIGALREEARRLGLVLSEDQVRAGAAANDSWNRLKATAEGLKRQLGAELFPVLLDVTSGISEWVQENRALITSGLHAFVLVLTTAVNLLRLAWRGLVETFEFVVKNARLIGFILGSVVLAAILLNIKALAAWVLAQIAAGAAAVKSALATAVAWGAAALPILALAAVIAGLGYVLWRWHDEVWAALQAVGRFFARVGVGIKDGFVAVFAFLRDVFDGFIGWVERQIDRVVRAARWVKDQVAPSGATLINQLGLTSTVASGFAKSNIAFGQEVGARAIANAPARGGGPVSVNQTNAPVFNISGVSDPSAVADEVEARYNTMRDADLRAAIVGAG